MHPLRHSTRRAALLLAVALLAPAGALADDWAPFAETGTIEIATENEDGSPRQTKIWIVVVDESGYIRTNDSRWLANIRRGSSIELHAGETKVPVTATEVDDEGTYDRVEEAFKTKYGAMQKFMSFFRMRTPTVLRLDVRAP